LIFSNSKKERLYKSQVSMQMLITSHNKKLQVTTQTIYLRTNPFNSSKESTQSARQLW